MLITRGPVGLKEIVFAMGGAAGRVGAAQYSNISNT